MSAGPIPLGRIIPGLTDSAGPKSPPRLPSLRQELDLVEGPRTKDGAPTWTLHDPVRNAYFRLGWSAFEILARWAPVTADELAARVKAETRLDVDREEVESLLRMLQDNHLVAAGAPGVWRVYAAHRERRRAGPWAWLLHHYLFFRVPLLRPDAALDCLTPFARPLFTRRFASLVVLALIAGLYLTGRQWDGFVARLAALTSFENLSWLMLALAGAKAVHELGHAVVAKRYGVRVPSAGLAFIVFWPRFYTETTDAWRLTDRRAQVAIDGAGIAAELVLAVAALLAWSFLPDGTLRDAALMIATVSWASTLAINLNPFMRFDGYYLLADAVGIPNLQPRAFALAVCHLRRTLLGFDEAAPELVPSTVRAWMIAYAWMVWVYRLVLFAGIALVVYHFFIKLVGIGLFLVEIGWFIARPVWREARTWWGRRAELRPTRSGFAALALLTAGFVALVVPWRGRVEAPAALRAAEFVRVFPATPGRLARVHVAEGARVAAGDPLVTLEAPDIEGQIAVVRARIAETQREIDLSAVTQASAERLGILAETLATDRRELALQEDLKSRLTVRAALGGQVRQLAEHLAPGRWISETESIALVVAPDVWTIHAYVSESDVATVEPGMQARFYPAQADVAPVPAVIEAVERTDLRTLPDAALAEPLGGTIAVRQREGRYEPVSAFYRVRLRAEPPTAVWHRTMRGEIAIAGAPRSLLRRWWQAIAAVLVRESGF